MKKFILVLALLISASSLLAYSDFGCKSGLLTKIEHGKVQCLYIWAVRHAHIKPWWVLGQSEEDGVTKYTVCDSHGGYTIISRFDYDSINSEWCDCPK